MSDLLTNDVLIFWVLVALAWRVIKPHADRHYRREAARKKSSRSA